MGRVHASGEMWSARTLRQGFLVIMDIFLEFILSESFSVQVFFVHDYFDKMAVQHCEFCLSHNSRIHFGCNRRTLWPQTNVIYNKKYIRVFFSVISDFRSYTKGYKKLCRVIIMMSYFGLRDWNFQNDNIDRLSTEIQRISNEENELEFDMKTIDWKEYFLFYLPGIKKYFFKENYSLLQQTRRHYQRWDINCVNCLINEYSYLYFAIRLHAIHVFLKYSFWMSLFSSSTYCVWKYIIKFIFQ